MNNFLNPVFDVTDIAKLIFSGNKEKKAKDYSEHDLKQIKNQRKESYVTLKKLLNKQMSSTMRAIKLAGSVDERDEIIKNNLIKEIANGKLESQLNTAEKRRLETKLKRTKKELDNLKSAEESIDDIDLEKKLGSDSKKGFISSSYEKIKGFFENDPTIGANVYVAKGVGLFGIATILKTAIDNMSTLTTKAQEAGYWTSRLLEDFNDFTKFDPKNLTTDMEAFSTLLDMRRNFGVALSLDRKTLDSIANYATTMGIASEEAMTMFKTLDGINGKSVEFNNEFIQSMFILSNKNKVSFKDVMSDITQNAEYFSTYMSDSEESIKRLVLGLRVAGIEFGTVSKILSGFTEVESTVSKQMKLGMFMGQSFDFLGVAQKQFEGDIEGATQLLVNQLSGVSEQQMSNPFLRKQLAEALGISVSELSQFYKRSKNKELNQVETEYKDSLDKLNENINSLGFTKLKTVFIQSILTPLANFVSENTKGIQSIFNGIGALVEVMGGISSTILKTTNAIDDVLGDTGWFSALTLTLGSVVGGVKLFNVMQAKMGGVQFKMATSLMSIDRGITYLAYRTGKFGKYGTPDALSGYNTSLDGGATRGEKYAKFAKGAGKALGVAGGVLVGGGALYGMTDGEKVSTMDYFTNAGALAGSGAMIGSAIAPGIGTAIGAGIGATVGLVGTGIKHLKNGTQMNQGGILVNSPVQIGNKILGDGQNGTQAEAVIPLNSDRGKQMMEINLSDSSIEKLLSGMKSMNMPINIVINNDTDKDKIQFRQLANYSSNLSFG